MKVIELDRRIEKDLEEFEKNISMYRKSLEELKGLRDKYDRETTNLRESYAERISITTNEYDQQLQLMKSIRNDINDSKQELQSLIINHEFKISVLDTKMKDVSIHYEEIWDSFKSEIITFLENSDSRINDKITNLENENKKELLKIINALSQNEKEITNSNTRITTLISEEIYKVFTNLELMKSMNKELEKDLLTLKSENEINSKELKEEILNKLAYEKEAIRLANKSLEETWYEQYSNLEVKYSRISKRLRNTTYFFAAIIVFILLFTIGR